jgi:hypothetical protein
LQYFCMQLQMLVQAGLPMYLRNDMWTLFMDAKKNTVQGYYRLLVETCTLESKHGAQADQWTCRNPMQPIKHTGRSRWPTGSITTPSVVGPFGYCGHGTKFGACMHTPSFLPLSRAACLHNLPGCLTNCAFTMPQKNLVLQQLSLRNSCGL